MSKKIKIVYLIGQLGLGGSERQLYLLLKHFDSQKLDVSVIVFNPSPHVTLDEAIRQLGFQVFEVPHSRVRILYRLFYIYTLLRRLSPDIIHSWTIHDNPYAGIIGWLARVPIRWGSVRGSIHTRGFQSLPAFLQWLSLKSVSKLIVNSDALAKELLGQHILSGDIIWIENCVDCDEPQTIPDLSEYGLEEEHKLIGTVGNIRRVKNHEMFIDSMLKIIPVREDVRSLIIGQPIPDEADLPEKLRSKIQILGLEGKVILAGFRADALSLMRRFTVFCLTSNSEGTPNAILEAMSVACPVVATRVGGIPDLVQDNVNGFLVEPGDVDGFANAVRNLLDDPVLARRMGRASQEMVRKHYSCEIITRQLEGIYLQAVADKR